MQPSSSNLLTLLSCSPYRPPTSADQINNIGLIIFRSKFIAKLIELTNKDEIIFEIWYI